MPPGKIIGAVLCLLAVGGTVVVLWGLTRQAWWAVAIPVGVLVVAAMTMLLWVGWTFIVTEAEAGEPPGGGRQPPF